MLTMPFGSSASVYAFLRTSLAIHALGARLFRLPWTCFYDDFPTVVPEPLANAATHLIKSLFTLLGFQVSDKPSKNPPFAAVFQALGVAFNLTQAISGVFEVANTEARIHLLASSLQELLTSHSLSPKEARRLRGRMQFAHGQLSGRYHSRCLSSLHELSALAPGSRAPPSLVRILQRCLQSLVNSMPRAVSSKDRLVWHLFTDGALEASKPSIGGVLVDFFGHPRFHFSFEPPALSVLTTFGSHCILHLEILPILVALHLWPDLLSGTAIFFHVDNEAALHSLIRMSCDNHAADQLVQHFLRLEQRMTFDTWIHRVVPTEVNVADAPSRGNETQLLSFQSQKSHVTPSVWNSLWSELQL